MQNPTNHGAPWSHDQDDRLMRAARRNAHSGAIPNLAAQHGRTETAISSRLYQLCRREALASNRSFNLLPTLGDERALFDYIRQQKSGFTRRAVRALWGDADYVARQTAYKQGFEAAQAKPYTPGDKVHCAADVYVCTKDGIKSICEFKMRPGIGKTASGFNAQLEAYRTAMIGERVHREAEKALFDALVYGTGVYSVDPFKACWGTADFIKPTEDTKPMNKFYNVVRDTHQPKMTRDEALAEAERLARANPQATYHIMEAVEAVSLVQPKVAVTTLKAAPKPRAKRKSRK